MTGGLHFLHYKVLFRIWKVKLILFVESNDVWKMQSEVKVYLHSY